MSVILEGMGQVLWQRQQKGKVPLGFLVSALEGDKTPISFHRATVPPGEASQERMNHTSQWAELRVVPMLTTREL